MYYGRYVDDILIVDKIEQNSDFHKKASNRELTKKEILEFFTEKCSRWNGFDNDCNSTDYSLLHGPRRNSMETKVDEQDSDMEYEINPKYYVVQNSNTKITLQNRKIGLFYFKCGETDALISCFRETINKNKSEFRFMPMDDMMFQPDSYGEIYSLESGDSPNKLRGVTGIAINKFNLSKYLGKYLRISGLIDDKLERNFVKDIEKIYNERMAVENFITWEKVIEIMVVNEQYNALKKFCSKIVSAISNITTINEHDDENAVIESMLEFLYAALIRSFALNWKKSSTKCFAEICKIINERFSDDYGVYEYSDVADLRLAYVKTRMIDKSIIPVLIDALIFDNDIDYLTDMEVNLTRFSDVVKIITEKKPAALDYLYSPYMVTMYDLAIFYAVEKMTKPYTPSKNRLNMLESFNTQRKKYVELNFGVDSDKDSVEVVCMKTMVGETTYGVKVNNEKKSKVKFAVANTQLFTSNFEELLKDNPNRKRDRYKEISQVINAAIGVETDVLVMPESYLPFEWLQTVARICAKNQIAIISGVEHVKIKDAIFNLTAVILPYKEDDFKTALISFHLKRHYAPNEKREIEGYRLTPIIGEHYELYNWRDCWFPVYCCYELASIKDRALFQSFADVVVPVEWNKDVNYYSNIMESLSRDLHCYCVQVNSSNFGDSRITQPSKTAVKDIIRTKGGSNSTVLVELLDIDKLRNFQFKEYELQRGDEIYKPTPPQFCSETIGLKMRGELWEQLKEESKHKMI